jgi:Protein of unknown function (DUF1501)
LSLAAWRTGCEYRCLLARGLIEEGARVVVVVSGGPAISQWDAHEDIEENHLQMAVHTDKPIAGLLKEAARAADSNARDLGPVGSSGPVYDMAVYRPECRNYTTSGCRTTRYLSV